MASNSVVNAIIDFIAGSFGGIALVYVGQPFDTIKVKMQTFPQIYTGMVDCFVKTYKNDGIRRGLYAGTIPAVVANVAENSVLFAGYGFCQNGLMQVLNKTEDELTVMEKATAGCLAAFGSSFTLCPTELIKCRLQAMRETQAALPKHIRKQIGPYDLTKQIVKQSGVSGLFQGIGATILREMPGYFFFFGGYEGTREFLRKKGQSKDDIGLLRTMVAGAVGGMIFWVVIFPADVIKSRMQIMYTKKSFLRNGLDIFRTEGALALYNGLLPTVLRTIPATATLFVVYEYSKKFMTQIMIN